MILKNKFRFQINQFLYNQEAFDIFKDVYIKKTFK